MTEDDLIVPPDLEYVNYIKAPPAKVWEALTTSASLEKIFFGFRVEGDWRRGSHWSFTGPDGVLHDEGVVLECDAPRRLKLSWRVMMTEETRKLGDFWVTYELEAKGEVTKLTMTQQVESRVPRKYVEGGKQGWPYLLSVLKSLIETGEGFRVTMTPP